ncbi:MAG: hypothetical protein A3G32_01995 [Deltaproteobacteria bacterium RIFCSPLOWO2_12_FULL_40_28]|nr:MAG: hypothetical protein A3C45_06740 [Deltaproteobacteria bacterium RIFCSPHIGHO2_02_FULL_40_28]OGQ18901.1 MAG: hypothetical protein A3E27_09375 [Deltaproteobacteria bacterium RIFCSPHIGHO2_12_FULL_40_32]OGQ40146.1 MAG: hypothetical protein A3I69_01905 [Deltaproteobacteria bacterium RIFCSPLOWO2_02_FULL_40_36]OGQ53329.1 MAG: hypothetical protein A3G32_01995 [Deltaproteobacteria bacterium RIFCSPLOWO2_12_FULL_40_28]
MGNAVDEPLSTACEGEFMPGIGVILNPYSRKYKNNPEMAKHMGFIVGDKASCKATEDLADLRRVAEEFKTRDIDILAINGGDGTIHCTLTTFLNVYGNKPLPKIALLRGGTLNNVATTANITGSSEAILSHLLVKYHEDKPFETREIMLTKINEEYGFIFGMGVIYNFMEAYYSKGNLTPFGAAINLIRSISSALINGHLARKMFARFDAEVVVNGTKWPFANYVALYTGSINQLGLNFRVYYLVDKNPDHFHAIGFSLPPRSILKYLPKMYLGKPAGCPNMIEEPAKEMMIKLKNPLPYTIDGDMKPATDFFHITCGPKITVIVR